MISIRRKIFWIIALSGIAVFSPLYLSLNMTKKTIQDVQTPNVIERDNQNKLSTVMVSTTTVDPIKDIVEVWNPLLKSKLNANDSAEFERRRKIGIFDGIKFRHLANLTRILQSPKGYCRNRTKMIVLVSSLCAHRELRAGIRKSWGNFSKKFDVDVLFFVGHCANATNENKETSDIVEADFVENYNNLTLKTLSRARWYLEYCNNTELVLFCDDDIMLDTQAILKHMPKYFNLFCNRNIYMPILREKVSKWYVPEWLLAGEYFPTYCSGFAYIFNTSVLGAIYEQCMDIPYIFVDDAFISGYATKALKLDIATDRRFNLGRQRNMNCDEETMFASHGYSGQTMVEEWTKRAKKCGYQ